MQLVTKSKCRDDYTLSGQCVGGAQRYPGSDRTMLQRWQKRDISNFEYLMHLNTAAGRTYNDYMQYPVFPWVLADYTSQNTEDVGVQLTVLNVLLTIVATGQIIMASVSRTKAPLACRRSLEQGLYSLLMLEHRGACVSTVCPSTGDMTVQCHYCTHYSSAIIVASYLVRMPPYTQAFCSLQGGSFDVADRMFHSVKNAWESASRENMSDVRELTPEFFYLPEFLINCNAVEFGCMQDGTALGDVQLPPWADGDPRKFISLHRQALESDFVSANLHHWIDLIFGYKQQGSAAVEAVNTFHPYFYGDKMDLSSIRDPLIRSTILGFVSNFGQVPKQLFTKPHPARSAAGKPSPGKDAVLPGSLPSHPQPFFYSLQALRPSQVTVKGSESPKGAIGHIVPTEKTILAVEKNKVLLPPLWNRTFSWGFDDCSCCLGNYGSDKILMTFENLAAWGRCLCTVCPAPTMIITSGASAVVCVWELSIAKGRPRSLHLKQALYGHTQAVTCLAASVAFSLLVSGSQDCTCILWDLDHLTHVARLPTHREGISALAISDVSKTPGVQCMDRMGKGIIEGGEMLKKAPGTNFGQKWSPGDIQIFLGIRLASQGTIVSCAGAHLSLWNVNGQPLASITTAWGPEGAITCCCVMEGPAWDTNHVIITGSQDGMVRIWRTEDMKTSVPGLATPEEPSAPPPSPRGHRWEKNLALCRELDVSLALTGKPSKTSPAVTALAVSRLVCWTGAQREQGAMLRRLTSVAETQDMDMRPPMSAREMGERHPSKQACTWQALPWACPYTKVKTYALRARSEGEYAGGRKEQAPDELKREAPGAAEVQKGTCSRLLPEQRVSGQAGIQPPDSRQSPGLCVGIAVKNNTDVTLSSSEEKRAWLSSSSSRADGTVASPGGMKGYPPTDKEPERVIKKQLGTRLCDRLQGECGDKADKGCPYGTPCALGRRKPSFHCPVPQR
ncbi:hypothetical protein PANDA_016914 [Ailuropoda melanoleuca]|uniref:BEACH domain-containing protein n=1 Tax=Ailuropoda melanoleuca TaxID=9646 RepID=D2HWK7_AILME|nr:hypothetical protein PANDA_016914 [Ailuropoda melanoleuca]